MAVMTEQSDDQRREMRWSANKKIDVVLRLLRGEPLDEVSRQVGVEAHRLAAWRDEVLAAGKIGLKGRVPAQDRMTAEQRRRLREAERKLGELTQRGNCPTSGTSDQTSQYGDTQVVRPWHGRPGPPSSPWI